MLRVWRPYYGVGYSPLYIYYELLILHNIIGEFGSSYRIGTLNKGADQKQTVENPEKGVSQHLILKQL